MKSAAERSAFEIAGEAFFLVRRAPLEALAWYYAGSVPFMLAFVFFWIDMSRGIFGVNRCLEMSALLACLFIWMKCGQSVFGSKLRAIIAGKPPSPWPLRRLARLAVFQAAYQPFGLLAIPASILVLFPFHCVHGFYQNLTVADDNPAAAAREVAETAWRHALVWPKQNHILIWLFSPWVFATAVIVVFFNAWILKSVNASIGFGPMDTASFLVTSMMVCSSICPLMFAIAGNVGMVLVLVPYLFGDLFGLHGLFTLSGPYAVMNTTFLVILYSLTYLCVDPLMKASYAIRCFYDASHRTGEDLILELGEGSR